MVVKIGQGSSFVGLAAYCLHDQREPGELRPETSERVEWTDTRNLPTDRPDRAAAVMAATAEAAPELKRLAGGSAGGRKLQKPVCHLSLSWAKDETPDLQEMSQAVDESLAAIGLEKHEALIVAHGDTGHPHVHVIVNRVDPETGKAAGLSKSKLRLSKWAEEYERRQGEIRCEKRFLNNLLRKDGTRRQDRVSLPTGRHRRERMNPHREPRRRVPAGQDRRAQAGVAWQRAEERQRWEPLQRRRWEKLQDLGRRARGEWAKLYERQGRQREQLAADGRGIWGRLRRWRQAVAFREFGGALRGSQAVLGRWRADLEQQHRRERVALGKTHFVEARAIEQEVGDVYRRGMAGSKARAEAAVKDESDAFWHYRDLPGDSWDLRGIAEHEKLQQVREIYGEQAYEERKRAWERASQPLVPSRLPSHDRPQRRGPERGEPERDSGPSR